MAQYADETSSEQDAYRAWQREQARRAAQAEAVARAQEQADAAARAAAAARERAAAQARAAAEARARAARVAAQAQAAARARAQEQAQRAEAAARERAAVQARAAEQARSQAAAQAQAAARARAEEQAQAAARAETAARERVAVETRADARATTVGPPPRGTAAYDAYLREILNGTTQGIAPGVGSYSEAGEPARRDGAHEPTLAEMLRDGFNPGSGATTALAKSVASPSVGGSPSRGTPAYDAYLRKMLNGTTQGIAPGIGSFSDAGEPARRTELTQPRPFSLLPNQDDELAAARVPVRSAPPSTDGGVAAGVPPRGTPAYDAYLKGVINGTTQGIAPGVGWFSEVGEPARRDGGARADVGGDAGGWVYAEERSAGTRASFALDW